MSTVRLELRLDQIVVPEGRLRGADMLEVAKVAASMAEVGQLQDIEVRPENERGKFPLNIGLHRLLAAEKIGMPTLWAQVFTGTDDEARLREIDENLHRHELNALDQAVFLAARREIYERLHGKIAPGRPKKKIGVHAHQLSFFDDTFELFGLSREVVKRAIGRFNRLTEPVRAMLRGSPTARSTREVDALARLEPAEQFTVAQLLAGETPPKNVAAAIAKARGVERRSLHIVKTATDRMTAIWTKASADERKAFLDWLTREGFLHGAKLTPKGRS